MLSSGLIEASRQLEYLAQRTDALAGGLDEDRLLKDVVVEEERPLVVTRLTALIDGLQVAAGEVRRAGAAQLRAEGLTHDQIAALFGVTRQRAAALLKDSAPPRPTPKRPHRPEE